MQGMDERTGRVRRPDILGVLPGVELLRESFAELVCRFTKGHFLGLFGQMEQCLVDRADELNSWLIAKGPVTGFDIHVGDV